MILIDHQQNEDRVEDARTRVINACARVLSAQAQTQAGLFLAILPFDLTNPNQPQPTNAPGIISTL